MLYILTYCLPHTDASQATKKFQQQQPKKADVKAKIRRLNELSEFEIVKRFKVCLPYT